MKHCRTCFAKVEEGAKTCQACGEDPSKDTSPHSGAKKVGPLPPELRSLYEANAPKRCITKGLVHELRSAYMKERIGPLGIRLGSTGIDLFVPPKISFEDIAFVPIEDIAIDPMSPLEDEICKVDALSFLKYFGLRVQEHLPNSLIHFTDSVQGRQIQAYWAAFTMRKDRGEPKDVLDDAMAQILICMDPKRPPITDLVEQAYAVKALTFDTNSARELLAQAKEGLAKARYPIRVAGGGTKDALFGPAYEQVAKGYLEVLDDRKEADAITQELNYGLSDAESLLSVSRMFLNLGDKDKVWKGLNYLHEQGNVKKPDGAFLKVEIEQWRQIALLWLELGDEKMANLAIEAHPWSCIPAPKVPYKVQTAREMAFSLFDYGL